MAAKKAPVRGIGLTPAKKSKASATPEPGMMSDAKYRAQDDMRTLRQAQEIMADGSRHRMAKRMAASEMTALAKVAKK